MVLIRGVWTCSRLGVHEPGLSREDTVGSKADMDARSDVVMRRASASSRIGIVDLATRFGSTLRAPKAEPFADDGFVCRAAKARLNIGSSIHVRTPELSHTIQSLRGEFDAARLSSFAKQLRT